MRNISGVNNYDDVITLDLGLEHHRRQGALTVLGVQSDNLGLTIGGAGDGGWSSAEIDLGTRRPDQNRNRHGRIVGFRQLFRRDHRRQRSLEICSNVAIADTGVVEILTPGTLESSISETFGSLFGGGKVLLDPGVTLTIGGNGGTTTFSGAIDETGATGLG